MGFLKPWQVGATLHRGARASHHCGLPLRDTISRCAGSAVVAHRLSCSAVCGILPDQGSNQCPLHRQADSQPLCHQGSPICSIFYSTRADSGNTDYLSLLNQPLHSLRAKFSTDWQNSQRTSHQASNRYLKTSSQN